MKHLFSIAAVAAMFLIASCGGGGEDAKLTEKGKLLSSIVWKYDTNASISGVTDAVKDTTGVTADIELKDDVKAIADFFTGTLQFGVDTKNAGKLSYERKFGEGFLSTSTTGWWEFNADESAVIMKEWDSVEGKEKAPVTYKIVELTAEKLVLQAEGEGANVYVPKK